MMGSGFTCVVFSLLLLVVCCGAEEQKRDFGEFLFKMSKNKDFVEKLQKSKQVVLSKLDEVALPTPSPSLSTTTADWWNDWLNGKQDWYKIRKEPSTTTTTTTLAPVMIPRMPGSFSDKLLASFLGDDEEDDSDSGEMGSGDKELAPSGHGLDTVLKPLARVPAHRKLVSDALSGEEVALPSELEKLAEGKEEMQDGELEIFRQAGIPMAHWTCCALGELAGEQGFGCVPHWYEDDDAIEQSGQRVHSRRMLDTQYYSVGYPTDAGRNIMQSFQSCTEHDDQREEFHHCCEVKSQEFIAREERRFSFSLAFS